MQAVTLEDIQRKYGDSVYPLYKGQMHEPYMVNDNGIGLSGAELHDPLEDKIICNECGKWLRAITGSHLKTHLMRTTEDYKLKYGLFLSTPLVSPGVSAKLRASMEGRQNALKPPKFSVEELSKFAQKANKKRKRIGIVNAQYNNNKGYCKAQIAGQLLVVSAQTGKRTQDLTSRDIRRYVPNIYSAMSKRYKNWANACKELDILNLDGKRFSDAVLIANLRDFVMKNKRQPMAKDYAKGTPNRMTFTSHFGSWCRAKMMAGVNQLLAETKMIETTT